MDFGVSLLASIEATNHKGDLKTRRALNLTYQCDIGGNHGFRIPYCYGKINRAEGCSSGVDIEMDITPYETICRLFYIYTYYT